MRKSFFIVCAILLALTAGNVFPGEVSTLAGPSPASQYQEDNPDAFSITGYEPGKFDNVSGGILSIYGSGFLPGTAVRLVDYGLLDSQVLNNKAVRALVPGGVKKGIYDVEVIRPDGHTWLLERAIKITDPKPKPTATASPRNTLVYGRPQVIIQAVETIPDTIDPGGSFTVTMQLINRGDYTATNIRISLNSPALAIPREGSSLQVIDTIAENQVVSLELPLALTREAPAGFHSLDLALQYSDYIGRSFDSNQSIGIEISDVASTQPLVLLQSYNTEPQTLSPGDRFTLRLEFMNVGKSEARQILLTMGGENGAGLSPFAILDSGNVRFVPSLAAGETIEIEHNLVVDGAATSGVYNLPVSLSYEAGDEIQNSAIQVLNVLVSRRPQLQVSFYRPVEPGFPGETFDLPVEVVNIGRNTLNVSTVEISSPDMQIENGSLFVGPLDGGTAGSLDALATPERGGKLPIQVTIHYLDDFNQPQVVTETLTVEVPEPETEPDPVNPGEAEAAEEELSLWDRVVRVVRALLGLGTGD